MSHFAELETTVVAAFGLIFITLVGKRAGWFKIIGGTNKLLKEQNQELRNQNEFLKGQLETSNAQHDQDKKDWAQRHQESLNEIAKLQGKVENLTAIPLRAIDKSLDELVQITKKNAESNQAILEQLQSSAELNLEDRDTASERNAHTHTEVTKIVKKDVTPLPKKGEK